jgi:hypothetical protein
MTHHNRQFDAAHDFKNRFKRSCLLSTTVIVVISISVKSIAADEPTTVFWDGQHLATIRASGDKEHPQYEKALNRLRRNAEGAMGRGPYSVTEKKRVAPSGDKHDYLSFARYWWPNPQTPDGLPYVLRDGRSNQRLIEQGDRVIIGAMCDDVQTLTLAGYLLKDERYSNYATLLVRTWFLDDDKKMNPHLKYGQVIPGGVDGRGYGIIDTRYFIQVLDAVRLLEESNSWTKEDSTALAAWMREYLHWLRSSPAGKEEQECRNNHGTWYDAQSAAIAMFVGDRALAKEIVEGAKQIRVRGCIEPDGSQPEELTRTRSLQYSVFSLSAMSVLARIGESVDVDLWGYETPDGRSIRRGLDFVMPALIGEEEWPHEQIEKMMISPDDSSLFYLAASRYQEPRYLAVFKKDGRRSDELKYTRLLFSAK